MEDIKKLNKLYGDILEYIPADKKIYIMLDKISDIVNAEIVRVLKENNINYKEYCEIVGAKI